MLDKSKADTPSANEGDLGRRSGGSAGREPAASHAVRLEVVGAKEL